MDFGGGFGSSDTNYSGTSTGSSTSNPPSWALPGFQLAGSDLLGLYQSGQGGPAMLGRSHIANLSKRTKQGIANMFGAGDWGGFDPGTLANISDASGYYRPMAEGEYLSGNPHFMQLLEEDTAKANDLIRSSASGMGRYGSEYMGDTVAENTRRMMLEGRAQDYNRERGYQMDAIQGLMNAAGLGSQLATQDFQNSLTGAGAQLAAGNILDEHRQRRLDDRVARKTAANNQDWIRLGMFLQGLGGAAGPYGTTQGTMTTSGQSDTDKSSFGFGFNSKG